MKRTYQWNTSQICAPFASDSAHTIWWSRTSKQDIFDDAKSASSPISIEVWCKAASSDWPGIFGNIWSNWETKRIRSGYLRDRFRVGYLENAHNNEQVGCFLCGTTHKIKMYLCNGYWRRRKGRNKLYKFPNVWSRKPKSWKQPVSREQSKEYWGAFIFHSYGNGTFLLLQWFWTSTLAMVCSAMFL